MDQSDLMRALGRIEGMLEEIQKDRQAISALSERVSKLERWRSYLAGAYATLAALVAAVLKYGK